MSCQLALRKIDRSNDKAGSDADLCTRKYKIGDSIGIGAFSKVKLGQHLLTGQRVAIKILKCQKMKDPKMKEKVRREIEISSSLVHPHIVRTYEAIETPSRIYIVMELMEAGDLVDYVSKKGILHEDEGRRIFQQIILGLEFCHRNMVAHRDLKLENMLLDSKGNVKIADFGLSNFMREGHLLKTSCGSPCYAAPEVFSGRLYAGPEIDVWSCGVILYAVLSGHFPFDDSNMAQLIKDVTSGTYILPNHLSPGARDLVSRMLVVDPTRRITVPEIRQHQWFQAHLPHHLAVPSPETMLCTHKIDEKILQIVHRMGFDKTQLVESLRNRKQDDATVTYYLLLDNWPSVFSSYLLAKSQGINGAMHTCYPSPRVVGHLFPGYMDYQDNFAVGLQSVGQLPDILANILRTLQELNVHWKSLESYNIKCRWYGLHGYPNCKINNPVQCNHYIGNELACSGNNVGSESILKFVVQLHEIHTNNYRLDLQRVKGPHFSFMDLCSAFLARFQVV
ncbi:hypothetical protein L1049_027893 [Liquidambar formosana]|uniref:non-specific serine/threonine protein kinase n=1 Tax=Liquidambar formosana TaxID=63359 RepID=A0AAP0RJE5_LIQFO